jgi:hypothetical protein
MQRCPNCGAYVMSDDNICPRCDHRLNQPVARVDPATEIFESPDLDEVASTADPVTAIFDSPASDEDETPEIVEETPLESESDIDAETGSPDEPTALPADDQAIDRARLPTTRLPSAFPVFMSTPAAASQEPPAEADISGALVDDETPAEDKEQEPDVGAVLAAPGEGVMPPADDQADSGDLIQEPQAENPAAEAEPPALEEVAPAPASIPAPFDLPESAGPLDAARTLPHLEDQLRVPEPDDEDTSELPTARLMPEEEEVPLKADETARQDVRPPYFVPPAPYTPPPTPTPPPPARITPPPVSYGYGMPAVPAMPAATTYLQQRVQAYRQGGYRLHVNSPYEATLSYGKGLGAVGWLLALVSIIGFFWYVLLMALGGFQRDIVDIVLEADGRIYEDGSGAAHIRRHRSRVGRRWAMFGVVIFVICLVLVIGLGAVAGIVLRNERYQAALREAYPAVTLFEEHFSATQADPADVNLAKDGAVAYAIIAGIAGVGLWGGMTLWVIGTIHAKTYRVHVPPLPGW